MTERRKHPRIETRHAVSVKVLMAVSGEEPTERRFSCTTHDLSLSGLRLISETELAAGVTLELSVQIAELPNEFLHRGQVRWSRRDEATGKYHVGVEFTLSSLRTRQLWKKYLEFVIASLDEEGGKPRPSPSLEPAPVPSS